MKKLQDVFLPLLRHFLRFLDLLFPRRDGFDRRLNQRAVIRRLLSLPWFYLRLFYKYIGRGWGNANGGPGNASICAPPRKPVHGTSIGPQTKSPTHGIYEIINDGDTVSLDGVAYSHSVYALSDSGLFKQSRASDIHLANIRQNERLVSESGRGSPAGSIRFSMHSGRRSRGDNISFQSDQISRVPSRNQTPSIQHSPQLHPSPLAEESSNQIHLRTPYSQLIWPNPGIIASVPEKVGSYRYTDRPIIECVEQKVAVDALDTSFDLPRTPQGWVRHVHPEGARYFSHEDMHVLTDANLLDPTILERVNNDVDLLLQVLEMRMGPRPSNLNWHLVISSRHRPDKTSIMTDYYFVDHNSRKLFYLDEFKGSDLGPIWDEAIGCNSLHHLAYEFEAQYWMFVSLYPTCRPLTKDIIQELREATLYGIGDHIFSPTALAPHPFETLEKILDWSRHMEYNVQEGFQAAGSLSLLARLMFNSYHDWFLHFHGEGHARLERHKSVYGFSTDRRTWLITIISPLLFSSPDVQLRHLQKMWVDNIMHKAMWEHTVKKLNEEWQDHVLIGTVLLNANMGFLAIGTVDVDGMAGNRERVRSASQIASYLSIVASIGSILLALLLLRQNRTKIKETVNDVQTFMNSRNHPRLGLEMLAILYSLPYALLMWSVVAFLVAFAVYCFRGTTAVTQGIVGSLSGVAAGLILWCIIQAWERKPAEDNESVADEPFSNAGSTAPLVNHPDGPVRSTTPIPGNSRNGDDSEAHNELPISVNVRKPTVEYMEMV